MFLVLGGAFLLTFLGYLILVIIGGVIAAFLAGFGNGVNRGESDSLIGRSRKDHKD